MRLCIITSIEPDTLSKSFFIMEGQLRRENGGKLLKGTAQSVDLSIEDFRRLLKSLEPNQALTFGTSEYKKARIVSKEMLTKSRATDGNLPIISRDREHFKWPEGAGVMMLDYDPATGEKPLSREALLHNLYGVWAGLEDAPHIWAVSASSCIHRADNGEQLRGVMGQRIYVPVRDARDIPRAGAVLFSRLFLAGHGRFDVSKSGSLLERSIVDASVWQPERLDFAGGAQCGSGLEQRRPDPVVFNSDAPFIDSRTLADLTNEEQLTLSRIKVDLRRSKAPAVKTQRALWLDQRVRDAMKSVRGKKKPDENVLRETYLRAVEQQRLLADFELISAKHGAVSVRTVLENPEKFHGEDFSDPLEPEYNNNPRIARAYLRDGRPCLWSFAHGGTKYSLHRELETIQLKAGELPRIVEHVLESMRRDGAVYERGDALVRITNGAVYNVTPEWLGLYLGGLIFFQKYDGRAKAWIPADCPEKLCRTILAMSGQWGLPVLEGLISLPTITTDGRVIQNDGFDPETGLYLHFSRMARWEPIPDTPNNEQVRTALETFFRPFRDFPYVDTLDRGACLGAALTATTQAHLPTKPGHAIDAPTASSGKSKLAESLSILAGAGGVLTAPPTNDKELGNILVTEIRECSPCLVFDNVERAFSSEKLASYLTSQIYSDRLLGASEMVRGRPGMVIITGNGLSIVGDLNRRFIRVRIDPQCEKPFERQFDLDPPTYVRENRLKMVHAALTILRASVRADFKPACGRLGSFEIWSDFIRRAVLWIGANGWLEVSDPVESIAENFENDPETEKLGRLLDAWWERFGEDGGTVLESRKAALEDENFRQILLEIARKDGQVDLRRLGNWIAKRKGKIVAGRRFVSNGQRDRYAVWEVHKGMSRMSQMSHFSTTWEKWQSDSFSVDAKTDSFDSFDSSNGRHCQACVNFTPNQMDPRRKPGVCHTPTDGRYAKMPEDGAGCARFECVTH